MTNRWWNNGNSDKLYFPGLQNHWGWWLQPWNQKAIASWQESNDKPSVLKSKDITLLTKVHIVKAMVFPVVMYWCERCTIKKAEHQRIDAFKLWCWRRLESPLDHKEIELVSPKGNQPWILIERTDVNAWATWCEQQTHWKRPDAGKD